jgi:hypothetical protein
MEKYEEGAVQGRAELHTFLHKMAEDNQLMIAAVHEGNNIKEKELGLRERELALREREVELALMREDNRRRELEQEAQKR